MVAGRTGPVTEEAELSPPPQCDDGRGTPYARPYFVAAFGTGRAVRAGLFAVNGVARREDRASEGAAAFSPQAWHRCKMSLAQACFGPSPRLPPPSRLALCRRPTASPSLLQQVRALPARCKGKGRRSGVGRRDDDADQGAHLLTSFRDGCLPRPSRTRPPRPSFARDISCRDRAGDSQTRPRLSRPWVPRTSYIPASL
jgi:hypothetical protein